MKTLVKFNKKRNIGGFTFHAGWFGEFSDRGELVKVYAYPDVTYNNFERVAGWNLSKVFYNEDGKFIDTWESRFWIPIEVREHFGNIAKYIGRVLNRRI